MENNKVRNAAKWSAITEVAAKLVTPVSNMILARLLTPEAFGVVATATMVFSFADMFTDSGFQKYLVQHEFADDDEKEKSTTVAFWTNMALSLLFWLLISLFSEQLAVLVGNPGMGNVLVIACISLPLTSFSSIQMAIYRREFDFKLLFYVRMVAALVPFVVTVPLAFLTHSYWALIAGTICGNLSNAVILTVKSPWKPRLYYNFSILKKMLSFSLWSLVEAVSIWMTNYVGIFIVGTYLSTYYLGLYKTSMNTVNQIMNLITSATTTVLFSTLSREQNDRRAFKKTFFVFQRNTGLFVIPMGVGLFLYRDFTTQVLLGNQWMEAAGFIGLWGLVNSIKIILSNYCSEAYRAIGKPKTSVFVQASQLAVLIPAIIYGAKRGFAVLYVMRCLVSCELIVVNLLTVYVVLHISPFMMLKNILPEVFASVLMGGVALGLQQVSNHFVWTCLSILICILVYFGVIFLIPKTRREYLPIAVNAWNKLAKKMKRRAAE